MILDVTVGSGAIYHKWHMKLNDPLIGIDVRKGDFSYRLPAQWTDVKVIINPTVLADLQHLPFKEQLFDAIVFDPPHMNLGLDTFMRKRYGGWSQTETIRILRRADTEFPRVLKENGFLFLKVLEKQFTLYETLLKHFAFFLPISTSRQWGAFKRKRAALWAIGQVKKDDVESRK